MPTVHLLVETSIESFGCQEAHRASRVSDLIILIREELADTEVTEDEVVLVVKEAILGLDVSMNYILKLMTVVDGRDELSEVLPDFGNR